MKNFLKNYLFIAIFIITIAITGVVNADNKVTGNTTDSEKTNNITTNTSTNNTTNKTNNNTTTNTTTNTTKTTTKSSNANLSTMGVSPKEYDFTGFNKNKTSYSVTVPNDVDSLKVAYKTEHAKAKVTVTGNNDLEVGSNTIKVVVTAEDGKTKKTYTIKVTKLATEDSKPGNLIDENDSTDLGLKSLSLKELDITPEFKKNVYSYEATIDMDTKDMSKVDVEAEADTKDATVEITGNTDLQEGENVINVIVKSKTSSEQTVYQITVNKVSKASEIASSGKKIRKEHIIIGLFITAAIIAIIIIIKMNKGRKDEEEYEYNDDFEDANSRDNVENKNSNDNFIEDLYKRRNDGQRLNKFEEETIEDIEKENDRIFNKPKRGEMFDYDRENDSEKDEFLEELRRRSKGKHF